MRPIDADELLKEINDVYSGYMLSEQFAPADFARMVEAAPAVDPSPAKKWIPVTERLPEEMGTYMTTVDYGKHGLATGQRYYYGQGLWEDDCVTAWMPLPKPYKEVK